LNDEDDGQVIPYSRENLDAIGCPYGNVRVWVQEKSDAPTHKSVGFLDYTRGHLDL